MGMLSAVEVVEPGQVVSQLSNPYGIATVFELSPEETKNIVPIARALIGNRSAVVIKTPAGDVKERVIPAGSIIVMGMIELYPSMYLLGPRGLWKPSNLSSYR